MRNTTTVIIVSEKKAIDYVCAMHPLQAKKVIFALTLLKGDERLNDSPIVELLNIAKQYDFIITAKYARELAGKIAKEYANAHPKTLLTKKEMATYTDARYRKLLEAVGEYGFDYILSALRNAKAYVSDPKNGVDERQMLKAMRWKETREDRDVKTSDEFQHRCGLKYAQFGDMVEYLANYTFLIANVYEMVQPDGTYAVIAEPKVDIEPKNPEMSILEMKIHFIQEAKLIQDFYGSRKPECPEGYEESELAEGTMIVKLAARGLMKDSKAILDYVKDAQRYNDCYDDVKEKFSKEEMRILTEMPDVIKALIANEW